MNKLKLKLMAVTSAITAILLFIAYLILGKNKAEKIAVTSKKREVKKKVEIMKRIAEEKGSDSHIKKRIEEIDNEIQQIENKSDNLGDLDDLRVLNDSLSSLGL